MTLFRWLESFLCGFAGHFAGMWLRETHAGVKEEVHRPLIFGIKSFLSIGW